MVVWPAGVCKPKRPVSETTSDRGAQRIRIRGPLPSTWSRQPPTFAPDAPITRETIAINTGDTLYSASMLFYDYSATIHTRYRALKRRAGISNFPTLSFFALTRCAKVETPNDDCKNVSRYDFPALRSRAAPFLREDGSRV